MEKWQGRVVLVTGANSGLGASVCQKLLKFRMIIIGIDKDTANIEKISRETGEKGRLVAMKCDITKEDEVYVIFDQIKKQFKGVDVCINNAGMTFDKSLLTGEPSEWREMLHVNVVASCLFAKLSIASMRERDVDDGHIINVCSLAGHQVFPVSDFHFYMVTKHAVKVFSEGLRQELEEIKSGIRISQVSPGAMKTNFFSRFSEEKFLNVTKNFPLLPSEDVADIFEQILSFPSKVEV